MFINEQFERKLNIFDYLIKYEELKLKEENKINAYIDNLTHDVISDEKFIRNLKKLLYELLSVDPNKFKKTNKESNSTQTEIKLITVDEQNTMKDYYETEVFDVKRNMHLLNLELSELLITYNNLINEKNNILQDLSNIKKECEILRLENDKLRWENDVLFIDYTELRDKISSKDGYISQLEKRLSSGLKENVYNNDKTIFNQVFENRKRIFDVCKYLSPKEVYRFKNSSKIFYNQMESNTNILKNVLYTVVSNKNKIINKVKDSLLEEYEENYSRLENLAAEYVNDDSKNIKEYASIILKASDFLNNRVMSHKDSRNNKKDISNLVSGFFNSISTISSSRTKESFSTFDRSSCSTSSEFVIFFKKVFRI
jgi:hypothetical protein